MHVQTLSVYSSSMHARWIACALVCAGLTTTSWAQAPASPAKGAPAKSPAAKKSTVQKAAPAAAAVTPAAPAGPPRDPGVYATLAISHGTKPLGNIVFKFYDKESPITTKNFIDLATAKKTWQNPRTGARVKTLFFNGLTFHRIIPGFMIQGGDPLGNGTGGTDPIPDEFHPTLKFDIPGRVAMANAGPGTGSSQFFITEGPTPHLTGKHTIFGQVVEGQALVGEIARLPRNGEDKPNVPVRITRVTITSVADPNAPPPPKPAIRKAPLKKAPAKAAAAPATKKT